MPSLLKLLPGAVFAQDYRVVRPLAEGGMGAVYVAEQLSTGKQRALKVMHPALVSDPRLRERFTQEARIGGQIESEHVVEVVAAGVDTPTGTPWLAMELLDGEDLGKLLARRGALPPEEARELLAQLCDGLGAAHARGVVHRDLKPENLYIAVSRRRGVPFTLKILDFGVARQVALGVASQGTMAVGTPLWMAPEQSDGRSLSPATDVWALGLIAFQVLTGRVYWRAANSADGLDMGGLLMEVLGGVIDPPSQRARDLGVQIPLPRGFDPWFLRCVSRAPEARFQHGGEAGAWLPAVFEQGAPAPRLMAQTPVAGAPMVVSQPPASVAQSGRTVAMEALPSVPLGLPSVPAGMSQGATVAMPSQGIPMGVPMGVPMGMPLHGGMYPPPAMGPPPRRRAVWPWVVGAVVLLGGACTVGLAIVGTTVLGGEHADAGATGAGTGPSTGQGGGGSPGDPDVSVPVENPAQGTWRWDDGQSVVWQGTWTDGDATWAFTMTLRRDDDQAAGEIQWTVTVPGSVSRGRPGDTGREFVRGHYHDTRRMLVLAGYQVDNPALLNPSEYRLRVLPDGAVSGHSPGTNHDWTPRMEGTVRQ